MAQTSQTAVERKKYFREGGQCGHVRWPRRLKQQTTNTRAQLVEHRTGIAEVMGSNPVEALIFFRLLLSSCLNWKIQCDDHSSLSSLTAVQIYELFHIKLTSKKKNANKKKETQIKKENANKKQETQNDKKKTQIKKKTQTKK